MSNLLTTGFNRIWSNFFGGKDQFTQNRYVTNARVGLYKGEQWVSTDADNLFQLYNTTAHLAAVINRKAAMLANGRWRHYRNGSEIENSPVVDVLENPSPLMNGNEFLRNISISRDIYGNSMVWLGRVLMPTPSIMNVLPMSHMKIYRTGKIYKQIDLNEIISSVKLEMGEMKEEYELKDIVWFKDIGTEDPLIGVSKIDSLMMPIANVRGAYGFRNRIITNDAMLGILTSDQKEGFGVPLDNTEQERINKGFTSKYGMQGGKSNIAMTEANAKWLPLVYPTKDLMLFEEVDQNFKIIIDSYGLNENIFSREKASTFSNLQEGIKLAYQDCIIPTAEDYALGFSKAIGFDTKKEWLSLDYSHLAILKEDEDKKADIQKKKAETMKILAEIGRKDLADSIEF